MLLDRPPRSVGLSSSRLVSGLWSCRFRLHGAFPGYLPVAVLPWFTPLPLRGQRRVQTGFPILRSLPGKRHLKCLDKSTRQNKRIGAETTSHLRKTTRRNSVPQSPCAWFDGAHHEGGWVDCMSKSNEVGTRRLLQSSTSLMVSPVEPRTAVLPTEIRF
ncbi:hypothetical protein FHS21_001730 [Phyllobacterium trifolii]|uniref:Uncharacterized protein n=1 Tax=Phyllobacterium trifolii TaxID=300193 RepID=A0A839U5P1_9HYPH|nr:hypothetical protein [Phyllobacterium trifolii]